MERVGLMLSVCITHAQKDARKLLYVMDMSVISIVLVVLWVYVYGPNSWSSVHQICAIFIYQSYLFVYI